MKYFVVDGDAAADVYGEAATPVEAVLVASEYFADGAAAAYLGGPVSLSDGRTLDHAFIVLTDVFIAENPELSERLLTGRDSSATHSRLIG